MCLIAFAIGLRPHSPLLLAANRDEFWQRPTRPLSRWPLGPGRSVVAGQDLQAGGTWLGFADDGRVAMLTNVRESRSDAAPRSRGELLTRWLSGEADTAQALATSVDPAAYRGFNLVLGDVQQGQWHWLSNRQHPDPAPGTPLPLPPGWLGRTLGPGLYGLSNAALDTPWPKTRRLKQALDAALAQLDDDPQAPDWRHTVLQALTERQTAAPAELPQTGLPLAQEVGLSAAFVHLPQAGYGTRSSLLARWHGPASDGGLTLEEWTHAPDAAAPCTDADADAADSTDRWPLAHSAYSAISMARWGMPTSS